MAYKNIRMLSIVAAVLSLTAVLITNFDFCELHYSGFDNREIYGIEIYIYPERWIMLFLGILGLLSLLWNLAWGAYAIIDGRYSILIWRIVRYGYFYGMVIGIINFVIIVGAADILLPAAWVYAAVIAVTVMVEIALIFIKDKKQIV